MKRYFQIVLSVLLLLAGASGAQAADELTSQLQKGLLAEEAQRDYNMALKAYQAAVAAYDTNRQAAATAVFRLAEVYRKLGRTNEARVQYGRILLEFADHSQLVSQASKQLQLDFTKLAAPQFFTVDYTGYQEWRRSREELRILETQLNYLKTLDSKELPVALLKAFSDENLSVLLKNQDEYRLQRVIKLRDFPKDHPEIEKLDRVLAENQKMIEALSAKILASLSFKIKLLSERLNGKADATAGKQAVNNTNSETEVIPVEEKSEIERLQLLLKNSPDLLNAKTGENQRTPLQEAAGKGQTYVAKFLISNGARVNLKIGISPLSLAAENGHKTMVELLLEAGAELEATDSNGNGRTALHRAVEKGNYTVTELLLNKGAQINAQDKNGYAPLHIAVLNEDGEMVKLLITKKAALNAKFALSGNIASRVGQQVSRRGTPMHLAAGKGFTPIIKLLVQAGAEVDSRNELGQTPLFLAALANSKEAVEYLLEKKADPNAVCTVASNSRASLHVTTKAEIAEALLKAGADVNAVTDQGLSALLIAIMDNNKELVAVLLRHHANTEPSSKHQRSPLLEVLQNNRDIDLLRMLLEAKADPNWESYELYNGQEVCFIPIQVVVGKKRADFAELLLSHKADKTVLNKEGETLLHMAVRNRDIPMVKLLLEQGADVNAVTKAGLTPYMYAVTPVNSARQPLLNEPPELLQELKRLLEEKGADKFYYRRARILLSRKSKGLEQEYFKQDNLKVNRLSLFELILKCYANQYGNGDFAFPDFSKITISRLTGNQTTNITVNVATELELGNSKADLWLEPGDMVEIPEGDHKLAEIWRGLPDAISATLKKSCARRVTLVVKDSRYDLQLAQSPIQMTRNVSVASSELPPALAPERSGKIATIATVQTFLSAFNLSEVAFGSKALLSSSDTKRIKVIRKSLNSPEKMELIYDIGAVRNSTDDLWLRDGDVIEVPERE